MDEEALYDICRSNVASKIRDFPMTDVILKKAMLIACNHNSTMVVRKLTREYAGKAIIHEVAEKLIYTGNYKYIKTIFYNFPEIFAKLRDLIFSNENFLIDILFAKECKCKYVCDMLHFKMNAGVRLEWVMNIMGIGPFDLPDETIKVLCVKVVDISATNISRHIRGKLFVMFKMGRFVDPKDTYRILLRYNRDFLDIAIKNSVVSYDDIVEVMRDLDFKYYMFRYNKDDPDDEFVNLLNSNMEKLTPFYLLWTMQRSEYFNHCAILATIHELYPEKTSELRIEYLKMAHTYHLHSMIELLHELFDYSDIEGSDTPKSVAKTPKRKNKHSLCIEITKGSSILPKDF